ncbi:dynactin subunit p27 [Fimicolochytrium jonesii]|uniref:dynactin subunit p27 n=1 Tax=Fimicolochytrium jonesii TaxID=1396493 RepID=UPI0022FEE95A|nr:dynactin subunit p27 [Fimicolochytrium jonesii]KAI8825822.1 dynactin subunit p27 [Fimicolochytrium jonesii]
MSLSNLPDPATRPPTICDGSVCKGLVEIGRNAVIHPKCRLINEASGSIVLGNGTIIEENVQIVNKTANPLLIGDNNIIEVGAYIESAQIGNGCTIEIGARVQRGTIIGDNCVIGVKCMTFPNQVIPDDTVIFGGQLATRKMTKSNKMQASLHAKHLEYLHETMPKYHHVKDETG